MSAGAESDEHFAREMFERMVQDDLLEKCRRTAGHYLPDCRTAAPVLVSEVARWLRERVPASLLRIGDGEGNALALTFPGVRKVDLDGFALKFARTVGVMLDHDQAYAFCTEMRRALEDADILGARTVDPEPRGPEIDLVARHLNDGRLYNALGLMNARKFVREMAFEGRLQTKILTSAWIHLGLIPYMDALLGAAERVVVVAGRVELKPAFEKRLGDKLLEFIAVPAEGRRPAAEPSTHYELSHEIADRLSTGDLSGTLVLVGAGLLGKIYCRSAKSGGAVALDLGSAFDVLAGMTTRPVHAHFQTECRFFNWR